jgi:DNA polymerase-1
MGKGIKKDTPPCFKCPYISSCNEESVLIPNIISEDPSKARVLFIDYVESESIGVTDAYTFLEHHLDKLGFDKDSWAYTTSLRTKVPKGEDEDSILKATKRCAKYYINRMVEYTGIHLVVFLGDKGSYGYTVSLLKECMSNKVDHSYRDILTDTIYFYLDNTYDIISFLNKGDPGPYNQYIETLNKIKAYIFLGVERRKLKYKYIDDLEKFADFYEEIQTKDLVAVDIETASLSPWAKHARVITIAFSWEECQGACVPLYHPETPFDCEEIRIVEDGIKDILTNNSSKIFHNGKFDCNYIAITMGIEVVNFDVDTMLVHYILDSTRGTHSLKKLALQYTDLGDYDHGLDKYVTDKKVDKSTGYAGVPIEVLWPYNCCDTDATLRIYNLFYPQIIIEDKQGLLKYLMRITRTLINVERNGFKLDQEVLTQLEESYPLKMINLESEFKSFPLVEKVRSYYQDVENFKKGKTAKVIEFNMASSAHVGRLFIKELSMWRYLNKHDIMQYLTEKGEEEYLKEDNNWDTLEDIPYQYYSMSSTTFKALLDIPEGDYPIHIRKMLEIMIEYNHFGKLYSGYVKRTRKEWIMSDGLVHSSNLVHGTLSGRLASAAPNTQNIPRGSEIKKMFISRFKGGYYLQLDYSQAEFRVATMLSGDRFLIDAYRKGIDIHMYTASMMYGVPYEEVTKSMRQEAKAINFGLIYGKGAPSLAYELGLSVEGATDLIENKYFGKFTALKDWLENCKISIWQEEKAVSMFGRVRKFPGIHALGFINRGRLVARENLPKHLRKRFYKALREGVNHIVQSSAADFMLKSLIYTQTYLEDSNMKSLILGTVYDSIMIDVHPEELCTIVKITKSILENIDKLEKLDWVTVPMVADCEVGNNWGSLSPIIFTEEDIPDPVLGNRIFYLPEQLYLEGVGTEESVEWGIYVDATGVSMEK